MIVNVSVSLIFLVLVVKILKMESYFVSGSLGSWSLEFGVYRNVT